MKVRWEVVEDSKNEYSIERELTYNQSIGYSAVKELDGWHIKEYFSDERGPVSIKDLTMQETGYGQNITTKKEAKSIVNRLKRGFDSYRDQVRERYGPW